MKRFLILGLLLFAFFTGSTQNFAAGIPDSVENVAFPGSTGAYTISNPLNHNGTSFTNAPIAGSCFMNCKSDYLYFHDFGMNIPVNATILGFEVIHTRGGCNQGSFVIDTLHLTLNGIPIGTAKRDSASTTETDTLGGSVDGWGAGFLPPLLVNNSGFGILINSTGTGICTFGQFDLRLKVYYCEFGLPDQGIPDSVVNVAFSGSTGAYTVSNPLVHNGTQFTNPPVSVNCVMNCRSDGLYFHGFGFNVPSGQLVNGIEVIHSRGGCNSGSFVIDTISLVYGGLPIGNTKRDSTSNMATDTLGDLADLWGNAGLTGAMVSDPSFGVMVRSSGTGICTFGQFDIRVNVYFCGEHVLASGQAFAPTALAFYPNPATDRIYWTFPETVSRVDCLNALGQRVDATRLGDQMDVSRLSNGIYFLRATRVDGEVETKRVVVHH